jgi:hypothetical protein
MFRSRKREIGGGREREGERERDGREQKQTDRERQMKTDGDRPLTFSNGDEYDLP